MTKPSSVLASGSFNGSIFEPFDLQGGVTVVGLGSVSDPYRVEVTLTEPLPANGARLLITEPKPQVDSYVMIWRVTQMSPGKWEVSARQMGVTGGEWYPSSNLTFDFIILAR